jgi:hypothetical protein
MRRRPNRELSEEQEEAADEFISGASEPPPSTAPTNQRETGSNGGSSHTRAYPWDEPQVRNDVKQTYPLRLPEPLHLKLKYLSEKTGKSMNELCNEAVEGLVEERLEEVLYEDSSS